MKNIKWWLTSILLAVALAVPLSYAVWPTTNVDTTDLDSDTDSPLAARADLYDLATKFNQVRGHVTTYIQGLLDDADATAARSTLGLGTIATQSASSVSITGGSVSLGSGTLVFPGATTPAQTSEGSAVWDTDGDLLTVGTGTVRKTLVNTDSTQTLTNKTISGGTLSGTITNSGSISGGTVSLGSGTLVVPGSVAPAQTVEGSVVWDTDDDLLTIGTGTARKTAADTDSAQTLTNKTISGGTLSGATLSGTTTNTGTISGGTISGAIISGATSISTSGTVSSTKACASGYTRITPNLCIKPDSSTTILTRDVCTAVNAPSPDAKVLLIRLEALSRTENGVGIRSAIVSGYSDSGCTQTTIYPVSANSVEFVAYGNMNSINRAIVISHVILPSPGATTYVRLLGGTYAQGLYNVVGYYD